MGHIHLGVLPNTVQWRGVVELLTQGAVDADVIAASAAAAERDLRRAPNDPVFVETVRLLAMIPQAAAGEDFGEDLRAIGLAVGDRPGLAELVSATGAWLDRYRQQGPAGSDFTERARQTLLGTMTATIGSQLPGLLTATPEDVQAASARLAKPSAFSSFTRTFFARLLSGTLASYLDRKLSTLVGSGQRFADMGKRQAFDGALDLYCMEATRIIREFAGAWYGKTILREGEVTSERAAAFSAIAFRKITEELRRKRGLHA